MILAKIRFCGLVGLTNSGIIVVCKSISSILSEILTENNSFKSTCYSVLLKPKCPSG